MKKCITCNIEFDGERKYCPLCQNALTGEAGPYNWPPIQQKTKKHAFFYKLQLLIVLASIAISLVLDFLLDINPGVRFSLVLAGWAITLEIMIRSFILKHPFPAKIISVSAVILSVLSCLTSAYLGFFTPVFYIAVPALIGATIIANFVFSFIDKRGNTLVYLLSTIVIGVIPYIALAIGHKEFLLPWTICLMISIVAFLGIIVFRGRKVLSELQKRFTF